MDKVTQTILELNLQTQNMDYMLTWIQILKLLKLTNFTGMQQNSKIGQLRSAAFSPKYDKIVGIAMVSIKFCKLSQKFEVKINEKLVKGEICSLPII